MRTPRNALAPRAHPLRILVVSVRWGLYVGITVVSVIWALKIVEDRSRAREVVAEPPPVNRRDLVREVGTGPPKPKPAFKPAFKPAPQPKTKAKEREGRILELEVEQLRDDVERLKREVEWLKRELARKPKPVRKPLQDPAAWLKSAPEPKAAEPARQRQKPLTEAEKKERAEKRAKIKAKIAEWDKATEKHHKEIVEGEAYIEVMRGSEYPYRNAQIEAKTAEIKELRTKTRNADKAKRILNKQLDELRETPR